MQMSTRVFFRLSFALVVLLTLLIFSGCSNLSNHSKEPMTEEEIAQVNTKTILEEYENIGFDPRSSSAESSAQSVGGFITSLSGSTIKVVSSDPSPYVEWKTLTITVVDSNESVYHINIGPVGTLSSIKDEEGNYLLTLIK